MALHDPDSTVREEAMLLKMGRQKKLQIINGKAVDVYTDEEDEDDFEYEEEEFAEYADESIDDTIDEERLMAVAEDDEEQQFVVVEVVNADGQAIEQSDHEENFILPTDDEVLHTLQNSKKLQEEPQDMENCFGFMVSVRMSPPPIGPSIALIHKY